MFAGDANATTVPDGKNLASLAMGSGRERPATSKMDLKFYAESPILNSSVPVRGIALAKPMGGL